MTNYLYQVDVRNFEPNGSRPTQKEIHEYVVAELNFFKGQWREDILDISHIIAIPHYGESKIDVIV